MRLIIIFQISLICLIAQARYFSGVDICRITQEIRTNEQGFFVNVPVDYSRPQGPHTQIYAWTLKTFDPQLKSFIYFVGGPGGSSHFLQFNGLENWNVIYFDQRGIGCSQFANEVQSLDPKSYSSEFIARDTDLIRQQLKIQKWSIYGHSYGTIPATIAASLFPESTRALVLEGTIYKADSTIWNAPHRMKWLQQFYNHLPDKLKKTIQEMSENPGGEQQFSQIAFSFMYLDNPGQRLLDYLNDVSLLLGLEKDRPLTDSSKLKDKSKSDELLEAKPLLYLSPTNYNMLTCRELSAMDPLANFYYNFKDEKFFLDSSEESLKKRIANCLELGIGQQSNLVQMFEAKQYSVGAPVSYFQGTTDGATQANQAVHHYKNVPQKYAQLLLKINGGHGPNLYLISSDLGKGKEQAPELAETQLKIFEQSLLGQRIEEELIEEFNLRSDSNWVRADRH